MNRILAFILITIVLAAGLISGCKDGVPQTELEMFIAQTAEFEGQALTDTLRGIALGEAPFNSYANFLLGNHFYDGASDSALVNGWNNPGAQTLLDSAEVYFSLAVAQDSTFIEPIVNLGSIWDDRSETVGNRQQFDERIAEANKYYNMALAVDPTDEKARCNLGSLYLRQRRTTEALAEFNKVLEYHPESSLAHYNLAIMFAEAKIYREALNEWGLASKYDPDGDIGERSRANIEIVHDLMNAPTPPLDH
jgi:tetratricopeptide (TPR) repeat protein